MPRLIYASNVFQLSDDDNAKQVYEESEPSTPVKYIPNGTPHNTPSKSTPKNSPNTAYNLRKRDRSHANGYL